MRLLTKQQVEKDKSLEKKREIDEGVKLARKVDKLREVSSQEEANLKRFRDESIKVVKIEIDGLLVKKEALKGEVVELEEKRILAQAPIDLKKEWSQVKIDKIEIEAWKRDLLSRESGVIAREATVESKTQDFIRRDEDIREKETLTNRFLTETKKAYDEAEETRNRADEYAKKTDKELDARDRVLAGKEEELKYREHELELEKEKVVKDRKANTDERLHIESQQKTLRTAWLEIKRLKK